MARTKAEEYRRLAQECRATARTLSTEQARAEMLAMAEVCESVSAQQKPLLENPNEKPESCYCSALPNGRPRASPAIRDG